MWIWYSAEERVDGKSDEDFSLVILQNLIHSVILNTLYLTSKASLICLLLPRSLLTTLVTAKWDAGISRCNSWPLIVPTPPTFFYSGHIFVPWFQHCSKSPTSRISPLSTSNPGDHPRTHSASHISCLSEFPKEQTGNRMMFLSPSI